MIPGEIAADPTLAPKTSGVYGWWFDDDLAAVPMHESVEFEGRRLLYVGIAPSAPSRSGKASTRTLRDRLKNHTRGPIAHSTLRRTLSVLLRPQLGLALRRTPSGKLALSREDETSLTEWMSEHARVAWMVHREPWIVEHALITAGPRLPLNIKDSPDPFRLELKALRQAAGG